MKDFTCPNSACGDGRRTVVAKKASPRQLVVAADVECARDDRGGFWVRCPACGRWIVWRGAVARQMARAA